MAPWVHTYLSPQTERRMCCASREAAQNFKQYIDTESGTGKYEPQPLNLWWNSEHMRSVRRRMMAGEELPECEVCNNKLLNTEVYRDYFWHMFRHRYDDIWEQTTDTGYTYINPVSWDYRFSNLCNFKCRMCGDMLSSAWESEQLQHNMVDWQDPKNSWMIPGTRQQISKFQDTQIESEFSHAVEEHRIEEVYWVGGEPLMYEQHWRYMQRIIELGDGPRVYARYNTNLSRIDYRGHNLFSDILANIRDWQICASLDGTGLTGEYIRTGLDYTRWLENFKTGLKYHTHRRQMRIDFTLTLPGMTELVAIERLAAELDVDILAKVVFSFTPDIVMSPLALPKSILHQWIDDLLEQLSNQTLINLLQQLKARPTFEEQWPDLYQSSLAKGKSRMLKLESIRPCGTNIDQILSNRMEAHDWWQSIG